MINIDHYKLLNQAKSGFFREITKNCTKNDFFTINI